MILSDTFRSKTSIEQNIELDIIISVWFSELSDLSCKYYNPYKDEKTDSLLEIENYNVLIKNIKSELHEIVISNEHLQTLIFLETFCETILSL